MYFAVLLINNDTIFNIIHLKISLDTLSDKIASIMVSFVSFYLSLFTSLLSAFVLRLTQTTLIDLFSQRLLILFILILRLHLVI